MPHPGVKRRHRRPPLRGGQAPLLMCAAIVMSEHHPRPSQKARRTNRRVYNRNKAAAVAHDHLRCSRQGSATRWSCRCTGRQQTRSSCLSSPTSSAARESCRAWNERVEDACSCACLRFENAATLCCRSSDTAAAAQAWHRIVKMLAHGERGSNTAASSGMCTIGAAHAQLTRGWLGRTAAAATVERLRETEGPTREARDALCAGVPRAVP